VRAGATQVFLYPEELLPAGPEDVAGLVDRLGIGGVSVALVYHSARRYLPRHGAVSTTGGGILAVPPGDGYGKLAPLPPPGELAGAVTDFRTECARRGLSFAAWIVGLHSQPLASAHPELQARWADGSPSGFALCPSHSDVLEYLVALCGDVERQLGPDAIDLEAWAYPAWEPAYMLTLAPALSDERRTELARCPCAACAALPEGGRERRVETVLAAVRSALSAPVRPLLFGPPEALPAQGITPRSLGDAPVCAGTGALEGDELTSRLRALTGRLGRPPALVSTNWAPGRTPAAMAADAKTIRAAGIDGLALYNLSLVPEEGLPALAAAAAAFGETAAP
jgi:hypothetical protein